MTLLSIRRALLTVEHAALREHMPDVNRLGDLGIKWRRLGEVGVTFVERGQYQHATEKLRANLGVMTSREVATRLNQTVLPGMPHGNDRFSAPVSNIDFMGRGKYLGIAYILDSPELIAQRKFVTDTLDKWNGVNAHWGNFEPHVTVATVDEVNAENSILDAFWEFAPETFTLLPAHAEGS